MARTRALVAGLILAGAVIGLPLILAATVGNPLHAWPELRAGGMSDTDVIDLLAAVFYLAWASFVIPLILEIIAALAARAGRRPARPVRLPLLGAQHDLARALLGAVLLIPATAAVVPGAYPPAAAAALRSADLPAPTAASLGKATGPGAATRTDLRPAPGAERPPSPAGDRHYVIPPVGGMRTYWALAEHYLSDGARWRQIWARNAGRVQPGGIVMDSPRRLEPGWTILIPPASPGASAGSPAHLVTVRPADTLSGLAAADGIGDWHQVWPANDGREEPGGRQFTDPNLIMPGWTIALPGPAVTTPDAAGPAGPDPAGEPNPGAPAATPPPPAPRPEPSVAVSLPAPPAASALARTPPAPPASVPGRVLPSDHSGAIAPAQRTHAPIPVPLEIGLAALAAVAVLDRTRRIAQRRRRPGHRPLPPPPRLDGVEARLRAQARRTQPAATAVQLAAALTAGSRVTVRAVIARDDGPIDLLCDPPAGTPVPAPFVPIEGGWRLPAEATGFGFGLDETADPYPSLAPVGRTTGGTVLVDLVAAGPVGVAGDPPAVQRFLAGLVRALVGAPWADRLVVHVPPALAARVGPLDHVTVEDTVRPAADLPDGPVPAGADIAAVDADGPGSAQEVEEPGWATRPVHVYCGWKADDDIEPLLHRAAHPAAGTGMLVAGLHPAAATWTLDGDRLLLPNLPNPITLAAAPQTTSHRDDSADLVERTTAAAAEDDPDEPDLPDLVERPAAAPAEDDPDEPGLPDLVERPAEDPLDEPDLPDLVERPAVAPAEDGPDEPDLPDLVERPAVAPAEDGRVEPVLPELVERPAVAPAEDGRVEPVLPELVERPAAAGDVPEADDVLDLLAHTATAGDAPVGDPRLRDFIADAPAAGASTPIQISVLGPVELAGRPFPRRSQTLNLLVYLALHRRGVDHDQIATALWPDAIVSAKTLRNRISEARNVVGSAISDGPRWQLDESVSTDWQQFTALAAGDNAQQHQALELVRGRPFAGLDDAEWIDLEGARTEVEAAVVDLALAVAERDLSAGDYPAAYGAARAGLAASRYEERLHRLAIRAAHAQGSAAKVRSLQREMRTVLDLDIEPDDQMQPDTAALYEDLRARRASS